MKYIRFSRNVAAVTLVIGLGLAGNNAFAMPMEEQTVVGGPANIMQTRSDEGVQFQENDRLIKVDGKVGVILIPRGKK